MDKTLFVVATPIGNLEDTSLRAIKTLKSVDYILAEDTRRTKILLDHYGVTTSTMSLHKFNERERLEEVKRLFEKYQNIALVSDAGTPLISDPGAIIVDYALDNHIKVAPVPGVSALTALISISGFSLSEQGLITFVGFLPHTEKAKIKLLGECLSNKQTVVFFESPNRVIKTLNLIAELSPTSTVVLGRELTKIYEETIRFEAQNYPKDIKERGEFTLLVTPGKKPIEIEKFTVFDPAKNEPRKIASILANYLNIKQKKAYDLLVKLKTEHKME